MAVNFLTKGFANVPLSAPGLGIELVDDEMKQASGTRPINHILLRRPNGMINVHTTGPGASKLFVFFFLDKIQVVTFFALMQRK